MEGGAAGDLYLQVRVLPHERYERDGDDLHVTVPVDLYTALLGGQVNVSTIDRTVSLTIPPETASLAEINLKPIEAGDYDITFKVKFKDSDQNEIDEVKTFPLSIKL